MTTFTEQSHLDMPPPGWLHINGVSLSTDVQQQPVHTSDYRTKHIISPVPNMISSPNSSMPFSTTTIDGQYQKFENTDLPKKLFIDRQIKKAKSLPGLIKGTALSHHTSLHSATNNNPDDSIAPPIIPDNDDESSPIHQNYERINETRRPRVSFSEFNKVQFFEDSSQGSQQSTNRRYRQRSSKKPTAIIGNNHISPPSIQHSQTLYTPYRSLSRQQQPITHELNIKKQRLIPSPRAHSSRITHLPDVMNQTMPIESSIHERYILQREKTLFQFAEPSMDMSEISRESTRGGGIRPSAAQDFYEQNNKYEISGDNGMNKLLNSNSISSSLTSRQRPFLRTISLRQQFNSPIKIKSTNFSSNYQTITTNSRRSASLKHSITRNHSIEDDHDEVHNQSLLSTYENRPMTGINSSKHIKRNYVIHFNSKNPFNGNTTIDSNETNRKSNFHEISQERFQNLLKIVRPPYITNTHTSNHDSTLQPTTNHLNESIRSSRANSGHDYHITSNTIYV